MKAAVLVAALLLGFMQPGPSDPLKEFKRAFRSMKEPAELQERRSLALKELLAKGPVSPAAADALVDAHLQLEKELLPLLEKRRAFLFSKLKEKKIKNRVEIDPLRMLQESIRTALVKMKNGAAVERAVSRAIEDRKMGLSLRIALAGRAACLGEEGWKQVAPRLKHSKKHGELLVGLEAARSLGKISIPLGERIISRLEHEQPAVREAAASALAAICLPESIVPLVDRLEAEEGLSRTRQRMADALQILTRQTFGTSIHAWRKWLEGDGKEYIAGKVDLGGGKIVRSASTSSTYHEIPMDGLSILYVIDCSNSMKRLLTKSSKAVDEEKETRFSRATRELIRALRSLPPYKKFNVLTFEGRCRLFEPGMVTASPKNIEKACLWVNYLEMKFGTQLYDALDLAFFTAGRPVEDLYYDSTIDTIFVLTDGYPILAGKNDSFDKILAGVRRWNLNRRVAIHTIGLGDNIPTKKLRRCAEQNGGKFVHEKSR